MTEEKPKVKSTIFEQIKEFEDEIRNTKYNKRTQHHIGLVKAKIARLKEKQETRTKSAKKGEGYAVKRTGDATVILVGFPSVGKSTLLNGLTNAESKVAAYAFTTLTVIPGLLEYKHAKIQLLDVPGVIRGAAAGTGRGKEVLAVMRSADLTVILVDVFEPYQLSVLKKEIYDSGIRINQKKPNVSIKQVSKGGLDISFVVKPTKIDRETASSVLREFKINNAQVVIRDDIDVDQLIDVIEANKRYIPAIIVLNKIDMVDDDYLKGVKAKISDCIPISAEKNINLDILKEEIFRKLTFIRIFLKEVGKKADMDVPLIMREGCTIKDVCEKIHRDFINKFKFARVWGKSAKFPGQKFMFDHKLTDEDVLQLHIK